MEDKSKEVSDVILWMFIVFFCAFIISGMFLYSKGTEVGKEGTIQQLCEKQNYDFCEQEKVIYRLKSEE